MKEWTEKKTIFEVNHAHSIMKSKRFTQEEWTKYVDVLVHAYAYCPKSMQDTVRGYIIDAEYRRVYC